MNPFFNLMQHGQRSMALEALNCQTVAKNQQQWVLASVVYYCNTTVLLHIAINNSKSSKLSHAVALPMPCLLIVYTPWVTKMCGYIFGYNMFFGWVLIFVPLETGMYIL